MTLHHKIWMICIVIVLAACQNNHNESGSVSQEGLISDPASLSWQDQKYSMFIHFGLYSMLGGEWNGEKVTYGYSEQIRAHGKIPKDEYRELALIFDPVKWDPAGIVSLAKRAGMRSIVITAKHHDGFSLFDTKFSDFDVVDASPYGKDILFGLSKACADADLDFGVYFSLIDWDYPDALPISSHNSDSIPPAHHQYNLNQVRELMTGYGDISEIWFDMGKPTFQQSKELANLVRELQPNCKISGRLWNDQGDFAVMGDNASPDFRMGTLWQTPASMFDDTWGYRSWQERKDPLTKAEEKLLALINVVANGGNYLLNIGPKGDGSIVAYEEKVLLEIGKWLDANGTSIYSSEVSPLPEQPWGSITMKPGRLFLYVDNTDQEIILEGLVSQPEAIYILGNPAQKFPYQSTPSGIRIDLSDLDSESLVPVLVVEYAEPLKYKPEELIVAESEGFSLDFENAIKYHSYSGADYYSSKPTIIKIEWLLPETDGEFDLIPGNAADFDRFSIKLNNKIIVDKNPIILDKGVNRLSIELSDQSNIHQDIDAQGVSLRIVEN